jgi:deoxyribose-phosphate aldolase
MRSIHPLADLVVGLIDHTALDDERSETAARRVCEEAIELRAAAVCVWPEYVELARTLIAPTSSIRIAAVANFPGGGQETAAVVADIESSIASGADEIDVVIPFGRITDETDADLASEQHLGHERRDAGLASITRFVRGCRDACGDTITLKTILEVEELDAALVADIAGAAIESGADFLKTSTGKSKTRFSTDEKLRAVAAMLDAIDRPRAGTSLTDAGRAADVGIKVSGGVSDVETAARYLALIRERRGKEWITPDHVRIGSSSLLTSLRRP